jgi:hypothetical protein
MDPPRVSGTSKRDLHMQECRHEMGPESERSATEKLYTDACPPYFMEQAQQGYSSKYPDSVYPTLTLILPPYPRPVVEPVEACQVMLISAF